MTETSRTAILHKEVLQDSSAPILQGYPFIHIQPTCAQLHYSVSREFSIQDPILHAEDKELFEYYYYIQRAKRPSFKKRNSTQRRQGDLLEIHPCVLQDHPKTFQAFQPQDLPKAFQSFQSFMTFQTFQTFQSFMTFQPFQAILQVPSISRESNPLQHSPTRMHILQFLHILQFNWFPQKLHRVPVEQYKHFYKHYILQRKGDVVISVKHISVKMSR